jgi:arylsulfatase
MMWPDGGYAPVRGEKGTTWEGGLRVPLVIRWPGQIPAGRSANGVQAHEDIFATLAAAAGLPNLKEDLVNGYEMNGTNYKVHLDGYNNLDYWTGKSEESARKEIFYYDETDLMAIRVGPWKMHIGVKPEGSWWDEKYYPSVPYVFNLLMDPMEKMDPQSHVWGYIGRKVFALKMWAPTSAGPYLAAHLQSLQEFPPSQGADTLSMKKAVDDAMKKLENPVGSSN